MPGQIKKGMNPQELKEHKRRYIARFRQEIYNDEAKHTEYKAIEAKRKRNSRWRKRAKKALGDNATEDDIKKQVQLYQTNYNKPKGISFFSRKREVKDEKKTHELEHHQMREAVEQLRPVIQKAFEKGVANISETVKEQAFIKEIDQKTQTILNNASKYKSVYKFVNDLHNFIATRAPKDGKRLGVVKLKSIQQYVSKIDLIHRELFNRPIMNPGEDLMFLKDFERVKTHILNRSDKISTQTAYFTAINGVIKYIDGLHKVYKDKYFSFLRNLASERDKQKCKTVLSQTESQENQIKALQNENMILKEKLEQVSRRLRVYESKQC